ncbi:MAG: DNA polymerase III subunit delta [Candidatus Margulisbacteria bacterium]|nr:DNA polymerase III subunit delta [Candidatus Margulisiibacteriota bacterium]
MTNQIFVYHGEEAFLVHEAVQKLLAQYSEYHTEQLPEKVDLDRLFSLVSTPTLFGGSSLIVIKGPLFLTQAITDKELKTLKTIFEQIQLGSHILVLYLPGKKMDQRKKISALLKKVANIQEFVSFKDWEQQKVFNWIQGRVTQSGNTIEREAVTTLESVGGTNLAHLDREIKKLEVYITPRSHITQKDVRAVTAGKGANLFDLGEAMKGRNLSQAMAALTALLNNGHDPIPILGLITSNIRLYYQMMILMQQKLPYPKMGQILKKNPYFLEKIGQSLRRSGFTIHFLEKGFHMLNQTDVAIKSGKMHPQKAVEITLVNLLSKHNVS